MTLPVEARAKPEAALAQIRDHRQRLHNQTKKGADAEETDALSRDVRCRYTRVRGGPVHPNEHAEGKNHDDVVEDRSPHHRAKLAASIEDLAHDYVNAHKEDGGQAIVGEGDSDVICCGLAGDGV